MMPYTKMIKNKSVLTIKVDPSPAYNPKKPLLATMSVAVPNIEGLVSNALTSPTFSAKCVRIKSRG